MLVIFLLFSFTLQSKPLITREYIDKLRKQVTWEVESYENSIFKGWTEEDFLQSFPSNKHDEPRETPADKSIKDPRELPENFDGRDKWGACVHPIRNQGVCGSCWSFAITSALSDRFCINKKDVILSPQHLIACLKTTGFNGCNGGNSVNAMKHIISQGVVTEKCYPYTLTKSKTTPPCPNKCTGRGDWTERYHCKAGTNKVITNIEEMQKEIINNGPICTHFIYRNSFNVYKSGIYDCTDPPYEDIGHFLKVIGWGSEKGVKYWILANSYGTTWGENGYIRFKMGVCGIDDYMYICSPAV